jgi:hypothetical protein
MANLDGTDEHFDSRDVIERIAEIEFVGADDPNRDFDPAMLDYEKREEYEALTAFRDEAEDYLPDWQYGETFISDDYFEDYARELAEDTGAIDPKATWPLNRIDWEAAAEDLKMDYTEFEFMGTTYWARG